VALSLPSCPGQLGSPSLRSLPAASTRGLGAPGCRASSARQRLRQRRGRSRPVSGIAAARRGGANWDPHELVALTSSAEARPRRPLGWGGTGWGSSPAPREGRRQSCQAVGAGQGVSDGQRSVALLVAVWHYLVSESCSRVCLRSLDAQPVHQLPGQLLTAKSPWSPRGYLD